MARAWRRSRAPGSPTRGPGPRSARWRRGRRPAGSGPSRQPHHGPAGPGRPTPQPRPSPLPGEVHRLGGRTGDDRVVELAQVVCRHRRRDGVGVDGAHGQVQAAEGEGIGADPAAEVMDRLDPRGAVAVRVSRRDGEPGGLLEAVGGEEQARGERAELVDRAGPEPGLGQCRGDKVRVENRPRAAGRPGPRPLHRHTGAVRRAERHLARGEPAHHVEVHAGIPHRPGPGPPPWHSS